MAKYQKQNKQIALEQMGQIGQRANLGLPFVQSDPSAQVQSAYFAFGILPFILVMSALTAWLWHIKVLKVIVDAFSKVCQKLFNIGGPIGLGAAANVFVGQVEASTCPTNTFAAAPNPIGPPILNSF